MKTLLTLLTALCFSCSALAQQGAASLDAVTAAVGAGDVPALVAAMGGELELSILDQESVHGSESAAAALRNFYAGLGKTNFGKVHQGASKADDAEYCIGTLSTDKGSYRVYVYVAKRGQRVVLQELRFDPA